MIPHTDYERLALLAELECGDKIIIPVSIEHANSMKTVADSYIKQRNRALLNTIKGHENGYTA